MTEARISPNQSLYIQNLPEKLQKEDLRRELYMLFSIYGPVLDVTALKTRKMRGQAHILFRDVQAATQAMRSCQNFDFFGRDMKISYSKSRSNTLALMSGVAVVPEIEPAQQSAFPLPPGAIPSILPAPVNTIPAPPRALPSAPTGLPAPPSNLPAPPPNGINAPSPQGVKRPREEDDDGEAPMDEDDSGEGEMDMSDDD